MIDILLVHPPIKEYSRDRFGFYRGSAQKAIPLGLSYIGSVLQENHFKVKILDMDLFKLNYEGYIEYVKKLKPKIIGVGVNTITYPISLKLAKITKDLDPTITVLFGGIHPSLFPESVIQEDSIDIVAIGEGEYSTLDIANCIIEGRGKLDDIRGIYFKTKTKKIMKNPERELIMDLDKLPFPARNLIIGNEKHEYYSLVAKKYPIGSIITSRGCPYHCIFCSKLYHSPVPRFRSTENVLEELSILANTYKIKDISIWDDTFNLKKQRIIKICQGMIKNQFDFYWRGILRPDLIDEFQIQLFKKSKCYLVFIGAESGSDKILQFLRKGYSVNQIKDAFNTINKYKIETQANFLVGIPGEKIEDIQKTAKLIREIHPTYLLISFLTAFPGTDLYNYLLKYNILNKPLEISNCIGFLHPSYIYDEFDEVAIKNIRKNMERSYYLDPSFIKNFGYFVFNDPYRYYRNAMKYLKYTII